jgi:hypothetical protein
LAEKKCREEKPPTKEGRKWQKKMAEKPNDEEEEFSNKDLTVLPSLRVTSKPSLLPVPFFFHSIIQFQTL